MSYPQRTAIVKVRSFELDSFGHVNNAVYLQYLEFARCEYLEQIGLSFNDFDAWEMYPVVVHTSMDYRKAARFGDTLLVTGGVTEWGRIRWTMQYRITRADEHGADSGEVIMDAKQIFVFLDKEGRPQPPPAPFRTAFDSPADIQKGEGT